MKTELKRILGHQSEQPKKKSWSGSVKNLKNIMAYAEGK